MADEKKTTKKAPEKKEPLRDSEGLPVVSMTNNAEDEVVETPGQDAAREAYEAEVAASAAEADERNAREFQEWIDGR